VVPYQKQRKSRQTHPKHATDYPEYIIVSVSKVEICDVEKQRNRHRRSTNSAQPAGEREQQRWAADTAMSGITGQRSEGAGDSREQRWKSKPAGDPTSHRYAAAIAGKRSVLLCAPQEQNGEAA
jgi:hypothetical protein